MRRAARTDMNQRDLVLALRQIGATVQSLASVGKGCPDLLVGVPNRGHLSPGRLNFLLEVKNPEQVPSHRRLNEHETEWHSTWRGQVSVVETFADVYELLGWRTL